MEGGDGRVMFRGINPICPETNIRCLFIYTAATLGYTLKHIPDKRSEELKQTLTVMLCEYGPMFAGAQ